MITRLPLNQLMKASVPRALRRHPTQWIRRHDSAHPRSSFPSIRSYSSPPPPPPPPPQASHPSPPADIASELPSSTLPPRKTPKSKRSLRPYIYALSFFVLGSIGGGYIRLILAPPPQPSADTKEDRLMVESLHRAAEKLPIVKSLSTDSAWTSHDAYTSLPEVERRSRLTTGPLAGARALGGFQRIFVNEESGELVSVIWFGGAVAGWPGVVHGGLSATILDESLGRCAIRQLEGNTGVTANLELTYLRPVLTNAFYVIRAAPMTEAHGTGMSGHSTKRWVAGRLEQMDGIVCVEAKGLFVVPKKYATRAMKTDF